MKRITSPTLLLDKNRVKRNIENMTRKADSKGITFRPHFKTHQSIEIGRWFRECGVHKITVSSVKMAHYFAADGWSDITIAFLVNPREIAEISSLAEYVSLGLLIDSLDALDPLVRKLKQSVDVWIKIDTGYGRTGVPWDDTTALLRLYRALRDAKHVHIRGVLTHNGETYHAGSVEEIRRLHAQSVDRMQKARTVLLDEGAEEIAVSIGDTPSCAVADDFGGIDEMRPGNFVFFDVMQLCIGACRTDEIAVAVACPVVGKYPGREQIVTYGGAVHLSKEYTTIKGDQKIYGYATRVQGDLFGEIEKESPVISLTQEHGVVQAMGSVLDRTAVGDLMFITPVHSCLTANLYREYVTLDAEVIGKL
ncbi:MAG: alanine racemase [candidate division KSB1 bacterium]|jgi:D-serine deaminase-like pyridoxal phosphate-dependent protein|nr:alanine racemase [candidate division KSB1 bacterium]